MRLPLDRYMLAIVTTVALALLLPSPAGWLPVIGFAGKVLIAVLFFLYGARLAPVAIWHGLLNWRLQILVLAATFGLFPLLGLAARVLVPTVLSPPLYVGFLFLCLLPSTVQSSIAFTGLAGGNIAAAVGATSASSVIGMLVTPLLAAMLLGTSGSVSISGLEDVVLQLQLPFLVGQMARRWIASWIERQRRLVGHVDRIAVLLIVYMAVSAATARGIWHIVQPFDLLGVLLADVALLVLAFGIITVTCRRLGLPRVDEIVVVFCGGNKGLVVGVSMITALLPPDIAGIAVLPLIFFHQVQLIGSATIASAYGRAGDNAKNPIHSRSGRGAERSEAERAGERGVSD